MDRDDGRHSVHCDLRHKPIHSLGRALRLREVKSPPRPAYRLPAPVFSFLPARAFVAPGEFRMKFLLRRVKSLDPQRWRSLAFLRSLRDDLANLDLLLIGDRR